MGRWKSLSYPDFLSNDVWTIWSHRIFFLINEGLCISILEIREAALLSFQREYLILNDYRWRITFPLRISSWSWLCSRRQFLHFPLCFQCFFPVLYYTLIFHLVPSTYFTSILVIRWPECLTQFNSMNFKSLCLPPFFDWRPPLPFEHWD